MTRPRLTYFCELESDALQDIFSVPVIAELASSAARISLGILDLSAQRAEVVRRLNEAGVPVVAWLLLPKDQGYWLNSENASLAAARYQAFKNWTQQSGLEWAGVGLGIGPNFSLVQQLPENRISLFGTLFRKSFNRRQLHNARDIYTALIWQMQADGCPVETYVLPFILDERKIHSAILQRATGLIDLSADREVLILFSSFSRPNSPGMLWSYAPDAAPDAAANYAKAIGLGSTGGGIELEGLNPPPLDWEELCRDLRLAYVYSSDIYVYSLEGCVRQGFLGRLKSFEWDRPIIEPAAKAVQVDNWRHTLQTILLVYRYILPAAAGVVGLIFFINWLRRKLS